MTKPLAYWCGSFRAPTPAGIAANIARARVWANAINRTGLVRVVLPHNCSAGLEASLPEDEWVEFTLDLSRVCAGILLDPLWSASVGSVGEQADAVAEGRPWVICQSIATVEDSVRALLAEINQRRADRDIFSAQVAP